ncbi:hypothetical protein [Paenibacillus spongiae]|uniref:Uncharacterized protein n=1 Tax=Paenibacillus spongiae TaxID=2909671 RepID=A0ABY5SG08_9BACL|nr:hypothetical protein [Paenibacillus spongiae]UVI32916.1 hypothetical protein L1F29_14235 [Paenibacillus spongiae]
MRRIRSAIGISSIPCRAHRSEIVKIEIRHRAVGGNQAWAEKYFTVRAVKQRGRIENG